MILTVDHSELYFNRLHGELARFEQLVAAVMGLYGGIQLLDDVYVLGRDRPGGDKKYPCMICAITHGNEVAGLVSLNAFLESLSLHEVVLDFPVVVALGNRKAALIGRRYVDADLNRCFALDETDRDVGYYEHQRAQDLEGILSDTEYLMDLHQTIGGSPKGFFIFSYSQPCYHFAHNILPYQDMVTYWSGPYTTEGICSDQYTRSQGGVAVTLELGSKGFENNQIAIGFQALLGTQGYVRRFHIQKQALSTSYHRGVGDPKIYVFHEVVAYPQIGEVKPIGTIDNFDHIHKGDVLGESSQCGTILAPVDGYALFPSLIHSGPQDLEQRPHELIRILKTIQVSDLPDL